MIKVNIPEHNATVEFPDNTSPEEIKAAIERQFSTAKVTGLPSVDRAIETYKKETSESYGAMKKMFTEPSGSNVLKGLISIPRYAWSVPTAAGELLGDPIERAGQLAGVPNAVTKVIADTARLAPSMVPYGAMVKNAIQVANTPQLSKAAREAIFMREAAKKKGVAIPKSVEPIPEKPPLEFPSQPSPQLAAEMEAAGSLSKPMIQEGIQAEIAQAAPEALKATYTETKRISQQIVDAIHADAFDMTKLPEVLQKYEIPIEEFALRLKDTYSASGRTLSRLSLTVKKLRDTFADNPEAVEMLTKLKSNLPEPVGFDRFMEGFSRLENFRRGLLVTQVATSMRNIVSQTGRLGIGIVDDAIGGAIRGTIGGEGNTLAQIGQGLDTVTAVLNRMKPEGRKMLANVLDTDGGALAKMRLYSAPVHEVTLGNKVSDTLNYLNRTQEYFFRNVAFEAKLRQLLKAKGKDYNFLAANAPSKIPDKMLEQATDYALEMTFAAMPKSKWGQKFVRDYAGNPFATALLNPFPRFAFANALPFIKEFSPAGFLTAFRPSVVAELASGNPERFAKAASRAIEGSMFLGLGAYQRMKAKQTGDGSKYYEVPVGEHYVDTRSYGPYNAYLLLGEMIVNPDNVSPADIAQSIIGLNRISGTGLALTDLMRSTKAETAGQFMNRLFSEYAGSFTVPARTVKDLVTAFNPEEGKIRDIRETPLVGRAMSNVPYLSQQLPVSPSPIREEPYSTEHPLLRQFSGVSARTKNDIEKELDRLNIDRSRIFPRTGVPEADRHLSAIMGQLLSKNVSELIATPAYQKARDTVKKMLLHAAFTQQKKEASNMLKNMNPKLAAQVAFHGQGEDVKKLIEELSGKSEYGLMQWLKEGGE